MIAGIISGIIGGIIVGSLSGSSLGVSGPAAGLVVVVVSGMNTLHGWENFLTAICLSGVIQIFMGYLRLGFVAYYFPNAVIKGMLTGIGIIIILKQLPHLVGYDADYFGDLDYYLNDINTISFLQSAFNNINEGIVIISMISILILIIWETNTIKQNKIVKKVPAPFLVVILGVICTYLSHNQLLPFTILNKQLVQIPIFDSISDIFRKISYPNLNALYDYNVYTVAMLISLIGSIETLLCVDATDKLDPAKNITPTNRELKAQGVGNLLSGLMGGLPITQVIVRSSANISFGGKSKLSTILHGFFILISVASIPKLINMIPLSSLACILLVVGYKLAKPQIFKEMFRDGYSQFNPFIVTIIVMQFSDLLKGVFSGLIVSIYYLLKKHYLNDYQCFKYEKGADNRYQICFAENVSFINKGTIIELFRKIPPGSFVTLDFTKNKLLDHDVEDAVDEFKISCIDKNISVTILGDIPKPE